MQIEIQTENFSLTDDLESYVTQRLGFDDSGQYDQVNHVLVKLSEIDTPQGNVNKNCVIKIILDGIPTSVEVENTEEDMLYAINLAAKRARKTALLWLRRYGSVNA